VSVHSANKPSQAEGIWLAASGKGLLIDSFGDVDLVPMALQDEFER